MVRKFCGAGNIAVVVAVVVVAAVVVVVAVTSCSPSKPCPPTAAALLPPCIVTCSGVTRKLSALGAAPAPILLLKMRAPHTHAQGSDTSTGSGVIVPAAIRRNVPTRCLLSCVHSTLTTIPNPNPRLYPVAILHSARYVCMYCSRRIIEEQRGSPTARTCR